MGGGEVARQKIEIRSSGDYTARRLASQEADIMISSNGHGTLWVKERLDARLSSSGNVYCCGNPTVTWDSTTSGQVVPAE